jgi:hypothetical protein
MSNMSKSIAIYRDMGPSESIVHRWLPTVTSMQADVMD